MCFMVVTQFSRIRRSFVIGDVGVVLRKDTDPKNDSAYKEQNYRSVCTKEDETNVHLIKDKVVVVVQFVDWSFILKKKKFFFLSKESFLYILR